MEISSDSDSDSSVDSEEKARLLEAAVCAAIPKGIDQTKTITTDKSHSPVRINEHKPGKGFSVNKSERERQLPSNKKSLRPTNSNQFDDDSGLNTTPESKKFIAKKLSQYLDKNIDGEQEFKVTQEHLEEDTGIRLFVKSSKLIKSDGCDMMLEMIQRQRKRQISSSSDSSDENERLAEAAVSHDFIIQQSRTSLPGSNQSQQDSLLNSDGDVINKHNGDVNNLNDKNTDDVESVGEKLHKKKKKKKKHKHITEIKVS